MTGTLTRIRNNQVYNSDIHAATKIVPGSITGALWNSQLTYTGNLTVGNLTINGDTTAIDTTNIISTDPVIVLNRNFSGANTYDVGLLLGRGNQTNTAIVWNESNKEFAFIYTSTSTNASYYGTLPNSGYANVHAYGGAFNNITVSTSSLTNLSSGNVRITGGYIDGTAIGANTPNTVVATSITTTNGGKITGYLTGAIGANTANTGAFTTITTTGTGSATTGAGQIYLNGATSNRIDFAQAGLGDPNVTTRSEGTKIVLYPLVDGSGVDYAIGLTSGVLWNSVHDETRSFKWFANTSPVATLTGVGNFTVQNQLIGYHTGAIGANTANSGAFTTLNATGTTTLLGQANLNTLTAVTMAAGTIGNAGALILGTNALITGNVGFGSVYANGAAGSQFIGYLTGAVGSNVANTGVFTSVTTVNGGQLTGYVTGPIGANTANTGVFTSVATVSGGQLTGYVTGPIGANTANTGVFTSVATVNGGQLTGYMTGPIGANTPNTGAFTTISVTNGSTANAYTTLYGGQLTGYHTGAIGANTANTGVFTSVTTVSGGQVTGYMTGPIGANAANSAAFTTLTSSGLTTFTDTTQASSYSSAAVVLSGGLGVTKDAWIHGNLTIDGNLLVYGARTIIGADTFSVLDPIIDLHTYANLAALTSNDGADIGLKLHYFDGTDSASFLGRDNATGYLVWEDKGTDIANVFTPTSVGTFKAGEIWLANTTTSTSTTTGVLRLDGGAGIKGNLFVGGGINGVIGNVNPASGVFTSVTTVSGGQLTGYHTGPIGANTANTGVFTSVTTTGGGQVTGYMTGPIGANTPNTVVATSVTTTNGGQLTGYVTGPIGANTANSGVFTSVTTVSGGQVTGYMTGPIGANAANSGAFTTLSASSTITLSGQANINTMTAATIAAATIGNTGALVQGATATFTGNIGTGSVYANGAAGSQFIGYLTGAIGSNVANTGAFTTLTASSTASVSGNLVAAATTSSTNTTTGSLVVKGGAGIAGDVNIGTSLTIDGGIYGNVVTTQFGSLFASAYGPNPYSIIQAWSPANSWGIGISAYTTAGPVLYSSGTITFRTGVTIRDKDYPTGGSTGVYIANGGNLVAQSGTASTNSTSGALVVVGGAGISGNVYSGSWLNATTGVAGPTVGTDTVTPYSTANINFTLPVNGNLVINNSGLAANLVVQGNTTAGYQNLLVTNGATGQVGIKRAPNSIKPYTSLDINATDSIILPSGTTGDRPPAGQEVKGMIRFNTTNNQLENWDGTQWSTGGASFTIISSDIFTGNGSQVNFTLSQVGTTSATIVAINGIVQIPSTAYTVSGSTLTFTEAPLSTDIIDARVLTTTVAVSALADGTSGITVSNSTPAIYATVQSANIWVSNTSTYFSGGISTFNANTSLTQNTLTTIDTFTKTKFRSAKYVITVSDFTGSKYQTAEILVVHDGTTATATQYGIISTSGSSFVSYAASVSGSNVILQANSTSAASYASVQQIYNPV